MQRWDTQRNDQRCLCCGGHITPEFRRGYGDRDDRAHRCTDCDTTRRLGQGSAAGKDVGDVDPLEQSSRFGVPMNELRQPFERSSNLEPSQSTGAKR